MESYKAKMRGLQAKMKESIANADDAEADLAETVSKAESMEAMVEEKNTELVEMEDELDRTESRLQEFSAGFATSEKECEENSQALKKLENQGSNDNERIHQLEMELQKLKDANKTVVDNLDALLVKLNEAEDKLDREEERAEKFDARAKELEAEVTLVGNSLRSMKLCEQKGLERANDGDVQVQNARSELAAMDRDAYTAEERRDELERILEEKDEEVKSVQLAYDATKVELITLEQDLLNL